MTKIRPLSDRIVVRRSEAEKTTASGLIIPDNAQKKSVEGTVVVVGPGRVLDNGTIVKCDVGEGDVVMFGQYAGTELELGGEKVVILRNDDILGVMTK